jgi:hypothetical protein
MHQTISAALAKARAAGPSLADVSAALAKGGLMGARGNSGVILSQILRGFAEAFASVPDAGGTELRDALARARANAFAAVERPAGGTMLSLCAAVDERVSTEGDIADVLRAAVEVGADALRHTMEDNPLNNAAGVVDAGAYGVWLLLLGALEAVDPKAAVAAPTLRRPGARVATTMAATDVAAWTGGHCVQYLISAPRRAADALRQEMVAAGADSVLVVGDAALMKVHAHAAKPQAVIGVGESAGSIEDLLVEDFDSMVAEHERATGIVLRSPPRAVASVAVVPGDGFAEIARSFYVMPLRGGATMNPSVGEIVAATLEANATTVILLPNDRNVVLAAREAAKQAGDGVRVEVIPTTSVAAGMAAVAAFDPMRPADEDIERMREAAEEAHGIEVTRATRDATIDGIEVRAGDAIALLDGRLVARGADAVGVLEDAGARLEGIGIATLYVGQGVSDSDAEAAADRLRAKLKGAEVEVRRGGQPHYPFIVQAE